MAKEKDVTLEDVVEQLKTNNLLLAALIKASGQFNEDDLFHLLSSAKMPFQDIAVVTGKAPHTIENKLSQMRHKEDETSKTDKASTAKDDK